MMTTRIPFDSYRRIVLVPFVAALLTVAACSDDPAQPSVEEETPTPASVTIVPGDFQPEVFGLDTLTAHVRDSAGSVLADAEVTWRSLDEDVATISPRGVVLGRAEGWVDLTARAGTVADTLRAFVIAPEEAVLIVERTEVVLGQQGEFQLGASFIMPDGTPIPGATLDWTSERPSLVEVTQDGVVRAGASLGTTRVAVHSTRGSRNIEVRVSHGWKEVMPGFRHTCAVDLEDRGYCWGSGTHGRLGVGAEARHQAWARPFPVAGNHRFATISPGEHHTCAIDTGGIAWCWGLNGRGALGTEESDPGCSTGQGTCTDEPVRVDIETTFVDIHAGEDHNCGVVADGSARCWGMNRSGQIGTPENFLSNTDPVRTPRRPELERSLEQVATGNFSWSHGLDSEGQTWVWGAHHWELPEDQIEDERCSTQRCFLPRLVPGGHRFTELAGGWDQTCGLTAAGDVLCWGRHGTAEPSRVPLGSPATALGRPHMALQQCALTEDGRLWCWPSRDPGAGVPVELRVPMPLRTLGVGLPRVCAVTVTNAAYCWTPDVGQPLSDAEPKLVPDPESSP